MPREAAFLSDFAKDRFDAASSSDREVLCSRLAAEISQTLRTEQFHTGVAGAVAELRALGHDLWSYDEEDAFEVWGPDYARPKGPGIIITFRADGSTEVAWSSGFSR